MKRSLLLLLVSTYLFGACPVAAVPGTCIDNVNALITNVTEESSSVCNKYETNCMQNDEKMRFAIASLEKSDYEVAFSIFYELAEAGNFLAQQNLAVLYNSGLGVAKDAEKAAYWIEKSSGNAKIALK